MAFAPMARQDTTQSVKCQTPKGQILVQSPPPNSAKESGTAGAGDSGSSPIMRLLVALTLCLGLWAELSAAIIPGRNRDGDGDRHPWCQRGASLAAHRARLSRE